MYDGASVNASMEEIYAVDYNSSVYQFAAPATFSEAPNLGVVEMVLTYILGWDGIKQKEKNQLGMTILTSSSEECVTLAFLTSKGAIKYTLMLHTFAEQGTNTVMKGYLSLPNQARSFDRFRLFRERTLPEASETVMDFSMLSMKLMQKRNTGSEPCIHVDNYDKVMQDS